MTGDKEMFKNEDEALFLQVLKMVKSIQYGCVQITVQDSKPVQIDKVEKIRLDKQSGRAPKIKNSKDPDEQ